MSASIKLAMLGGSRVFPQKEFGSFHGKVPEFYCVLGMYGVTVPGEDCAIVGFKSLDSCVEFWNKYFTDLED